MENYRCCRYAIGFVKEPAWCSTVCCNPAPVVDLYLSLRSYWLVHSVFELKLPEEVQHIHCAAGSDQK